MFGDEKGTACRFRCWTNGRARRFTVPWICTAANFICSSTTGRTWKTQYSFWSGFWKKGTPSPSEFSSFGTGQLFTQGTWSKIFWAPSIRVWSTVHGEYTVYYLHQMLQTKTQSKIAGSKQRTTSEREFLRTWLSPKLSNHLKMLSMNSILISINSIGTCNSTNHIGMLYFHNQWRDCQQFGR